MEDNAKLFTTLRYDPALLDLPDQGFSSLGWNQDPSPFYMLDYHRDRMLRAATYWAWPKAVEAVEGEQGLSRLEDYLNPLAGQFGRVPQRLTVTLDREGRLGHAAGPREKTDMRNLFPGALPAPLHAHGDPGDAEGDVAVAVRGPAWHVLVDSTATTASVYTHYKTTRRDVYNAARERAQLALTDSKEVLLVNDADGQIMEGSLTTPYFWRHGRWVTPPVPATFAPGQGSGGNDGTTRRWALERNLAVEAPVPSQSLVDGEECWLSNGARGFVFGRVRLTPIGVAGCCPEDRPDARPDGDIK